MSNTVTSADLDELVDLYIHDDWGRLREKSRLLSNLINHKGKRDFNLIAMSVLDRHIKEQASIQDDYYILREIISDELTEEGEDNLVDVSIGQDQTTINNLIAIYNSDGYERLVAKALSAVSKSTHQPSTISNYSANSVQELAIVIHGTWPKKNGNWWKKGGDFWNYLDSKGVPLYQGSTPFDWCGSNSHSARDSAARNLEFWARGRSENLDIYAHSHGGNVALLATRMGLKINKLVIMGTPVRYEYPPDMNNINKLYCVYSSSDRVQKVGGYPNTRGDGRTLADTDKIINCHADRNSKNSSPGHSQLHEPVTWKRSELLSYII